MAHSSLLKYRRPAECPDFELDFFRDPLASAGLNVSTAGGVATSERVIKGGGGIVGFVEEAAEAGEGDGGPEAEGESVSESFSHTMSGDQIRSGKERTSRGGARSAFFCLVFSNAEHCFIRRCKMRTWQF